MPFEDLLAALRAAVGARHVLRDADVKAAYERDVTGRFSGSAAAVVRPADAAEVRGVLAACSAAGVRVVAQGGNTGLAGGAIPFDGEVVVSLQRLQRLEPIDMLSAQVSVGAGVTLETLQRHARAAGLRFLVDHGARSAATIGGMVATNAGGPLALRHGTMRAQVAGLEVVLPDGRTIERMNGLLKDNAGYDFVPLLVGSEGTLGIVTAARLRLAREPGERLTLLAGLDSIDDAVELVSALRTRLDALEAADFFTAAGMRLVCAHRRLTPPFADEHELYVVLELAGEGDLADALHAALEPVEGLVRDVAVATDTARREALWRFRESHNEVVNASGVPLKLDVSVAPLAVPAFVDALHGGCRDWPDVAPILYGHLGDGNVHVNLLGVEPERRAAVEAAVLDLVGEHGGSISAEHGIGRAKATALDRTRSADEIALMRAVKAAFDPERALGVGRVLA